MAKIEKTEPSFKKEQLLASKKYENDVDLINALLDEDKVYTLAETDKVISQFKKGKVN